MPNLAGEEYTRRLQGSRSLFQRLERTHIRIGNVQAGLGVAILTLALIALGWKLFSVLWLLVPLAAIVVLAVVHERVIRKRALAGRSVRFYEYALDRVQDRWAGKGETGERFLDQEHPYAKDLDLFGPGSLFEYLSTARTRGGEETLARWLLGPASPADLAIRQDAVRELVPKLDLRERLAVLGEDVRVGVNPDALASWGAEAPRLLSRHTWLLTGILSVLALATGVVWAVYGIAAPFIAVFAAGRLLVYRLHKDLDHLIDAVERPSHDLNLLSEVLRVLEQQRFASRRLTEISTMLEVEGKPPSQRIAKLNRLMELLDSRHNPFYAVIDVVLLCTLHVAFAIESWREKSGPHLGQWLAVVGETEALLSLSGYSYEHHADPFPEFTSDSPRFEGVALGHPLIPESRCVCNDLTLDGRLRALVVSGSNMSGKSTLLRTVGTNVVLAMAGAPVRAKRLRLSPLTLGASIRTVDSLQTGTSRFYAEILRLRQLLELTQGPPPLLFLLDELLHGTNSHDRRIGAEGVVRALVARGAIGLVTTHDLALADMVEQLSPLAANAHFADRIEDGRIQFDYRLRPGVVEHSNALELMRSVGLEV